MPQDGYRSLLIKTMDNVAFLKSSSTFLKLALQQLDNPNEETLEVVDLLISTYLNHFDAFIDEIEVIELKRKKITN